MASVYTFRGTSLQCGIAYAERYQREMAGFFSQEFGTYSYSKQFVRACLRVMKSEAPHAAMFIRGAADRSLLSVEEHALLLLQEEELYHRKLRSKKPHCSVVGVLARTRKSCSAIVGQNWDWNTSYYPWSSINRFAIKGAPKIVALSYPGLPVCAGMNSSGLSLLWTGSGYYPALNPKVGVPTYALVLETLLKRDVTGAIQYLKRVHNAGAFIFFLGDGRGKLAVVEAVPGKVFVTYSDYAHRANVFESPEAIAAANQNLPQASKCHSIKRSRIFARTSLRVRQKQNLESVKKIISQPNILIEKSFSHATLLQLIADSRRRELHLRSWRQKDSAWVTVTA